MDHKQKLRDRIRLVEYKIASASNVPPFWGTPTEHVEREGYIEKKKEQLAALKAELEG